MKLSPAAMVAWRVLFLSSGEIGLAGVPTADLGLQKKTDTLTVANVSFARDPSPLMAGRKEVFAGVQFGQAVGRSGFYLTLEFGHRDALKLLNVGVGA
jgi:hypothetical protein